MECSRDLQYYQINGGILSIDNKSDRSMVRFELWQNPKDIPTIGEKLHSQ